MNSIIAEIVLYIFLWFFIVFLVFSDRRKLNNCVNFLIDIKDKIMKEPYRDPGNLPCNSVINIYRRRWVMPFVCTIIAFLGFGVGIETHLLFSTDGKNEVENVCREEMHSIMQRDFFNNVRNADRINCSRNQKLKTIEVAGLMYALCQCPENIVDAATEVNDVTIEADKATIVVDDATFENNDVIEVE